MYMSNSQKKWTRDKPNSYDYNYVPAQRTQMNPELLDMCYIQEIMAIVK